MSIPEPGLVGKEAAHIGGFNAIPRDILVFGAVISASLASFGLGAVSDLGQAPSAQNTAQAAVITAVEPSPEQAAAPAVAPAAKAKAAKAPVGHASGTYVASKNGTKIYLPTCSGAKRIKAENMIWFVSKEEAAAAGFTPSVTCKGM